MRRLISLDEKPALDLKFRHFTHQHGPILVIGSWYMDPETREAEPVMVLMDARKRPKQAIPCLIRLSDMWRWTREIGDPLHVATEIASWLASGALPGNPANKADAFRVMDAVLSRLRDIWSMPPLPPEAAVTHGAVPIGTLDVIDKDTGEITDQIEVHSANVRS